jgi:hypothetical protein
MSRQARTTQLGFSKLRRLRGWWSSALISARQRSNGSRGTVTALQYPQLYPPVLSCQQFLLERSLAAIVSGHWVYRTTIRDGILARFSESLAEKSFRHDNCHSFGGIAQLVERLVRNEKVRGSNPLTSSRAGALAKADTPLPKKLT